ncbi:flagellar biosynthesis protein FlhB [Tersicoccus sp. Bi-70]|uniref:EscU/YscU/HrcU family type III secretion system export apparatus switch protein n=1 Tax=Tersicoccus sp. Bi-70 TaxID=1897634 RepID=UPI00097736B7|nr:EscU/YscU/HrcU family type III secretion system export apparatus switch protein [Tersicoccus sp. Bi-70]OMH37581.1 type III secretion protein [Tersicoccus sp. Bi-70]
MADAQERTEEATDKRMREVRSKGKLSRSQDATAWLAVGAAAVMTVPTIGAGEAALRKQLAVVPQIIAHPDPEAATRALGDAFSDLGGVLAPLFAVTVAAVLAGSVLQGGIHVKKFRLTGEHFNLVAGFGRMFGGQALWGGAKALLKTAVVGIVLVFAIQSLVPVLMTAGGLPISGLLSAAGGGAVSLLQGAVVSGLLLAGLDVLVVARRNRKQTRMTKREVKDESKSSEGDPLIRSQRRARQMAMSRNRMIAAIADADVVLVNPTHVAVALKYEPGRSAPRVVAKGADRIADRIRAEAKEKGVPMVKDIPLARALHGACDIGQEIPLELYTAVAGVLAFVMSLAARGVTGGMHEIATSPHAGSSILGPRVAVR